MDDLTRLQPYLRPGEQLLWCGRPDAGVWFTAADLYLIPFSILWCGFAIFWEAGASQGGGPLFIAWGIPFIAVGLYMVIGRFFYKHHRKKQTSYGITSQRALVAIGARSLADSPWGNQPVTIRRSRSGGHASVIFQDAVPSRSFFRRNSAGVPGNTGLDSFPWRTASPQVAFYDVPDADAMLAALNQASGMTYGERSRHRPGSSALPGSFPLRGQPRPARPRPRIPVPAPVLVFTAAVAVAAAAVGGLHIVDRVSAWSSHAIYLHAGHPVAAQLAPGQYTVFAGCTQEMTTCARLDPGSVTVRGASGEIDVVPDPSSDHDSEGPGGGGQPFVGELSFSIPRASAVQIELAAAPGQPVFVVPSEGQLARSLAGWIALTATALVILLASLAGLAILAWWRLTPALS